MERKVSSPGDGIPWFYETDDGNSESTSGDSE
jgi:hypothetical protein